MKALVISVLVFASTSVFAFNRESGGRPSMNAVYTYFSSFGTGVDRVSLQKAEAFIQDAVANGSVVDLVRSQKGREGETLICVEFNEPGLRVDYIRNIAPTILADRAEAAANRTSVRTGLDCSNYEAATEQDLRAYLK